MTIQADVDRGLKIREEIQLLLNELNAIEERLEKAALKGDQVPLEDADRDGRQWVAKGTKEAVSVILTADSIVSGFADGSATHMQLVSILDAKLKEFFRLAWTNRFKDGKAFRTKAQEVLGEKAPRLITACLARDKAGAPKSKIVVAWNEARPTERKAS